MTETAHAVVTADAVRKRHAPPTVEKSAKTSLHNWYREHQVKALAPRSDIREYRADILSELKLLLDDEHSLSRFCDISRLCHKASKYYTLIFHHCNITNIILIIFSME